MGNTLHKLKIKFECSCVLIEHFLYASASTQYLHHSFVGNTAEVAVKLYSKGSRRTNSDERQTIDGFNGGWKSDVGDPPQSYISMVKNMSFTQYKPYLLIMSCINCYVSPVAGVH